MISCVDATGVSVIVTSGESGAAIGDAVITLTRGEDLSEFVLVTDAQGRCDASVPPGRYDVAAEKEGFVWAIRRGLVIETGQGFTVPIALEVDLNPQGIITLNCGGGSEDADPEPRQ